MGFGKQLLFYVCGQNGFVPTVVYSEGPVFSDGWGVALSVF